MNFDSTVKNGCHYFIQAAFQVLKVHYSVIRMLFAIIQTHDTLRKRRKNCFAYLLVQTLRRNTLKKLSYMQYRNNLLKPKFPNEFFSTKWHCQLLLYFTSIIDLCIRFKYNKGVKIKYVQFSMNCFIIQSHMRCSCTRGLIELSNNGILKILQTATSRILTSSEIQQEK